MELTHCVPCVVFITIEGGRLLQCRRQHTNSYRQPNRGRISEYYHCISATVIDQTASVLYRQEFTAKVRYHVKLRGSLSFAAARPTAKADKELKTTAARQQLVSILLVLDLPGAY